MLSKSSEDIMKKRILIIEDEPDIANILRYTFKGEGFEVRHAVSGEEGSEIVHQFDPNIVLLDLMLPGISGFDVCKELAKYSSPVIMLTARNDIVDKIMGLELGADDYITKPFNIRECVTRVNVALRRMEKVSIAEVRRSSYIKIDNIDIYQDARKIHIDGEEIKLKPKEIDLLFYLVDNKNIALTREQILDSVWGYDYIGDHRTVDVHIRRLRQKLKDNKAIETVFGTGYMLRVGNI